ncbi:MAG TPA: hypothetical protein ENF87_00585, partial [Thermoproteales archaeon]|nr:hypothetical protein [Thermoproteales archaeon]
MIGLKLKGKVLHENTVPLPPKVFYEIYGEWGEYTSEEYFIEIAKSIYKLFMGEKIENLPRYRVIPKLEILK